MINVHGLRRNVKNVVKNYSEAQVKVREATSNDPWGPSGTLMSEIADLTYNVVAFSEIMQVIWKRLNDHGKNWKHVYKALVLLDYLIKTGSEKVTQQCKENIFAIQTLKDFQYFEESKDQGVNVREKAKQLVALLKDDERLKNERARALKARERFARSSSYVKHDPLPRQIGADFNERTYEENSASLTSLSLSELEQARPQTIGEEELQLQLALAMSREEADQAERVKRNDDLRLQMALSESQEEFKKQEPEPPGASAIEDLLGLSVTHAMSSSPTPLLDPWGMPIDLPPRRKNSNVMDEWDSPTPTSIPEQNQNSRNDPWSPCSENLIDNGDSSGEFLSSFEENKNISYGMKKSVSADAYCDEKANQKSLDAFLNSKSSLIQLDGTRTRNVGNPFQAAKPPPPTINEMRAQNGSFQQSANESLPSSTSMPYFPQNNPFL